MQLAVVAVSSASGTKTAWFYVTFAEMGNDQNG